MNKPISKHTLRRAMERVEKDGFLQYSEPIGTVVDRIWHEIEKKTYNGGKKKASSRVVARSPAVADVSDIDIP